MATRPPAPTQLRLDDPTDADTPLHTTTFVVVDLETTGTNRTDDRITEIGAVKIRGGRNLGEFSTLVDPQRPIPPAVTSITGITDALVAGAPRIDTVLPAFLEFCRGCVLVAHNAPFDTGFLQAQCERLEITWPKPASICTARLSRRALLREETPNHKLATLARVLRAANQPNHRALDDARATVDVLHSLLERVGTYGVRTLEELHSFLPAVTSQQRRQRTLADELPHAPGVYLFRGPNDEVLYIGTAGDLKKRVRQYFTSAERRSRIREMVGLAHRVEHVRCAHPLEAEVRELRLLAAHRPRYNRRSRHPERAWWVVLTEEPFPRLSAVRNPRPEALGPFSSRGRAQQAVDALHDGTMLRRCTQRLPRTPADSPCALHELGRCHAPCAGLQSTADYGTEVAAVRALMRGTGDEPLRQLHDELARLGRDQRFEEAAAHRDRMAALIRTLDRGHRNASLCAVPELVAAHPDGAGGWQLAVIRYGRLAAAGHAQRGVPPMPVVDQLQAAAQTVRAGTGPLRGAPAEEAQIIHRWLTADGTRLVRCAEPWSEPAHAAGTWRRWAEQADAGRTPYGAAD
ncbi:DEDD exonuclease domain-containing protein [Bounagaea algeriensis]